MSVSANASSTVQEPLLAAESIGISVTSRITYNLRFTKQAVLVIGDNTAQYSQLANQFLVNLSQVKPTVNTLDTDGGHINIAFVASSEKLNDIQIRCRLIEQLFFNTLFDPEQSLAISVLRFAKVQGKAITILIDHAQTLSLQVKYELCQLAILAKKSKLTINVVLFGLTETAQQLAMNKPLFKGHMTVIDAGSGQVISLDNKKVSAKNINYLVSWQKLSWLGAILFIGVALIAGYLVMAEHDNQQKFKIHQSNVNNLNKPTATSAELIDVISNETVIKQDSDAKNQQLKVSTQENESLIKNQANTQTNTQATSEEINRQLLTVNLAKPIIKLPAESADVMQALVTADNTIEASNVSLISKVDIGQNNRAEITNNYYQTEAKAYKNGYVVQIAGLFDEKLLNKFLSRYPQEDFHHYNRWLNDKAFTVITSIVFKNKAAANASIALLPKQLIERKPWVRPISSVINEINTFTR